MNRGAAVASSPAPPASAFGGFDDLTASNYYDCVGIAGAQAGFHIQAWVYVESQAVASANRVFLANAIASTNGYRFLTAGANATLNFGAYDSTGSVTRVSGVLTLTAGHIGRPLHVCGGIRAGQLLLWVDGVPVGLPTTITTYAPSGAPNMSLGRRMSDTLSCLGDIQVLGGVAGGHYAPSDVEVLAAYTAGLAAKDIVHIPGGTAEQSWSFKNIGPTAPASIAQGVGSEALTRRGSPTYVSV